MSSQVDFTRQAQKDAKSLAASGLKEKAESLIAILAKNPYQSPPPFVSTPSVGLPNRKLRRGVVSP